MPSGSMVSRIVEGQRSRDPPSTWGYNLYQLVSQWITRRVHLHSRTAGGATITMVPFPTTKLLCSDGTTICFPSATLVYGIGPSNLLNVLGPDSGAGEAMGEV